MQFEIIWSDIACPNLSDCIEIHFTELKEVEHVGEVVVLASRRLMTELR